MAEPGLSVSVVIPARNEAATLEAAVAPLLAAEPPVLEVIIAVAPSTDGTLSVVERMVADDPRVVRIDNPSGTIPDGLNAAIRASRGELILRMDGHSRPVDGYVAACVRTLRTSGAWCVGGRMIKRGTTAFGRASAAAMTSPYGIGGGRRYHLVTDSLDLPHVWLGCWPRRVFERVGLFGPEMLRNEDEELSRRVIEAGGRIRFDPSIAAIYVSRSTPWALLRQFSYYGRYRVRGVQKHPSMLRLRHLFPPATVAILVLLLVAAFVNLSALAVVGLAVLAWLGAAAWFARAIAVKFDASVPNVMLAFGCMHLGYGAGFWWGTLWFAPRWFINRRGTVPRLTDPVWPAGTIGEPDRAG